MRPKILVSLLQLLILDSSQNRTFKSAGLRQRRLQRRYDKNVIKCSTLIKLTFRGVTTQSTAGCVMLQIFYIAESRVEWRQRSVSKAPTRRAVWWCACTQHAEATRWQSDDDRRTGPRSVCVMKWTVFGSGHSAHMTPRPAMLAARKLLNSGVVVLSCMSQISGACRPTADSSRYVALALAALAFLASALDVPACSTCFACRQAPSQKSQHRNQRQTRFYFNFVTYVL